MKKSELRKIIKEEIQRLNEYSGKGWYEVEYYEDSAGHGDAGGHPDFNKAYKMGLDLYKKAKKEGTLENDILYIGISPVGEVTSDEGYDEFAIIYITKEYIDTISSSYFDDAGDFKNWGNAAKKSLRSGKPVKGKF